MKKVLNIPIAEMDKFTNRQKDKLKNWHTDKQTRGQKHTWSIRHNRQIDTLTSRQIDNGQTDKWTNGKTQTERNNLLR